MRTVKVVTCMVFFAVVTSEAKKYYEGHSVLKVEPSERIQVKILRDLEKDPELDFWSHRLNVDSPVHIHVSPERYTYLKSILERYRIKYSVFIENLQTKVDEEQNRLNKRFKVPGQYAFNIDDFNNYDDTMAWVEQLKGQCASGVTCTTYSIGTSIEGRDLKVMKISTGSGKKAYWIDSAIHAREWLSPATVNKIANHLVNDYSSDAEVKRLVDTYDWYIMFIMNPDGYVFSWTDERYWRKNRNPNDGDACLGVDLNRNYNIRWMNDGSSTDPCSNIYAGASPASEPETQAHQNEANRLAPNLLAWLTVHTNAQMWIHPFGHTNAAGACDLPDDHDRMMAISNAAADAVENQGGLVWRRGNSCQVLSPASGATDDYVKGVSRVPYSATPELRGDDFVVPPTEIQPSYEEVWAGVVAMVNTINGLQMDK